MDVHTHHQPTSSPGPECDESGPDAESTPQQSNSLAPSPSWQWTSPQAQAALATRSLATILRCYRQLTHTSQRQLATSLGYDPTYISAIENARRSITNAPELRRIATHIGIPTHILGITDGHDTDYRDLIAFAESTL